MLDRGRNPRPNGIALSKDGSHLFVSNCCQGTHLANCSQGFVNYNIYSLDEHEAHFLDTIEFSVDGPGGRRGCADGFKVHHGTDLIVGSCPSGICVVGTGLNSRRNPAQPERDASSSGDHAEDGKVLARGSGEASAAHAAGYGRGLLARLDIGRKVSNVVFGGDGYLYATGESASGGGHGALMRLPLRASPPLEISGSQISSREEL